MKRVFCIGNGESRQGFDLEKLRPHGKIYGCNAIYRDFMPDVLTAVDHGIMHEIYHAGVAQKIPCYFRDWTKVPAMTYEQMLYGAMDKTEADKTGASDREVTSYNVAYTVSDDISIGYGVETFDTAGSSVDEETRGFNISYTTGGMTLGAMQVEAEGVGNSASSEKDRWKLSASFAF